MKTKKPLKRLLNGELRWRRTEKVFQMPVWVICWPTGTTREYRGERFADSPRSLMPCGMETHLKFKYWDSKRKRSIWGWSAAIFSSSQEANAWLDADGSRKSFVIRRGFVQIGKDKRNYRKTK